MKQTLFSPSVLFLITFVVAIVLSFIKPWRMSLYIDEDVARWIGVAVLFVSLLVNTLAYRLFKKHHTPHAPFGVPTLLIQKGVFSLSRNPVYVALVLSQCGLGFVFDTVWLFWGALVLLVLLNFLIVPDEEKMLEKSFADAYEAYKKKTRRWI